MNDQKLNIQINRDDIGDLFHTLMGLNEFLAVDDSGTVNDLSDPLQNCLYLLDQICLDNNVYDQLEQAE